LRDTGRAIGPGQAVVLGADLAPVIAFDIAATDDPVAADRGQARGNVDHRVWIGIRPAGVVDVERRLARGRFEHYLAHRDP